MALVLHHTLVPLVQGCGDGKVNDDEKSHFRHLSIRLPLSCCFLPRLRTLSMAALSHSTCQRPSRRLVLAQLWQSKLVPMPNCSLIANLKLVLVALDILTEDKRDRLIPGALQDIIDEGIGCLVVCPALQIFHSWFTFLRSDFTHELGLCNGGNKTSKTSCKLLRPTADIPGRWRAGGRDRC